MRKLLFFSRVAFICNICFAAVSLMHYVPVLANGIVPSVFIILGTVMAIALNILMNILYLVLAVGRSPLLSETPGWLIAVNFSFLLIQIILLVK